MTICSLCRGTAVWVVNDEGYCKAHKAQAIAAQANSARSWDKRPWWDKVEQPKRMQAKRRFITRLGEL